MAPSGIMSWPRPVKVKAFVSGSLLLASSIVGLASPRFTFFCSLAIIVGGALALDVYFRIQLLDETPTDDRSKMVAMLSEAKGRVFITSGRLDPTAWVDWERGAARAAIEERLRNGVRFEIICGEINPRTATAYAALRRGYPNEFKIYRSQTNPVPHGIYVEGGSLRLERPHDDTEGGTRQNGFLRRPGIAISIFMTTFENYRSRAVLLSADALDALPAPDRLSKS